MSNKSHSRFYQEHTGHYTRREWRGLKDTLVDYKYWLKNWGALILLILKAPVATVKAVFKYRWMWSLLISFGTLDYSKENLKGTPLKVANMNFNTVVNSLADLLYKFFKTPSDKVLYYDLNQITTLYSGFEGYEALSPALVAVYVPSIMDQLSAYVYIDVTETYGVPADVCPLPQAEAGAAIEDDLIVKGVCGLATNMPCDGSIMSSSIVERRLKMPIYPLTSPMRYNNEDATNFMVNDMKAAIKFMEDHTGATYNYDLLRKNLEKANLQNEYLLKKWELNTTDYPIYTGAWAWLYRVWAFSAVGLNEDRFLENDKKTLALMQKAVKNKELIHPQQKYRAILWSTPCNYYSHFESWLLNCWGIVTVFSMLGDSGALEPQDLTTDDDLLIATAKHTSRATMRKQTNGGYENSLDELWDRCAEFKPDIVFLYDHLNCKGMAGIISVYEEQADEKDIKLCTVPQELIDSRTISRRDMREKVNNFMINVMKAEPVDASLLDFDDTTGH